MQLQTTQNALVLEDGSSFAGQLLHSGDVTAEVVFTTGMCGYVETLTDPSFAGQIVVFTYPMIGNYGICSDDCESKRIFASGVVVSEACEQWSHSGASKSLLTWLEKEGVPLLAGVDTRALTKRLRKAGTMLGSIGQPKTAKRSHLVSLVSSVQKRVYGEGKRVIVVDCGMKENILRQLKQFPVELVCVPYDYDYSDEPFDAVFLSNGPGDPEDCGKTVAILQKAMKKEKPIYGICLGSQLMALACGAKTYKLPFGHRGQNQPCMELETGRCYITSQNHGYAIDSSTLPDNWKVTFKNLNDESVEGIAHKELPFYAVQFHPEAAPGPTDTRWLFEKFIKCLENRS
ncbi:MAG: Carbamoyl-phosphate synthase small chain [Chlamydiales bacterium]|nr:Carbamoyl-phosphate synthase small chain [Chlamydiales bacterium]MCH9636195.1 Carbamoyl-phosphate synthase small chain [Chlamydiales bacterium]MCH9704083.1 glutamine-hydrolyzing carbamoyl-phosphate synthase small subunit [Chlamydiota bacterium]